MTLGELARSSNFCDVWQILLREYSDFGYELLFDQFETAFHKFQTHKPTPSNNKIIIICEDSEDYTRWDVFRIIDGDPDRYDLEFAPWSMALGMEFEEETLTRLNPTEIVAHCLQEMTFYSFDEEETQALRREMGIKRYDLNTLNNEAL